MKKNRFRAAAGKTLAVVTVALIVISVLAPGASAAGKYKILHQFSGTDGSDPEDNLLIFDAAGNMYGTTYSGGAYGEGTVFNLTPNSDGTWTESVLYSLAGGSDLRNPMAGVISDSSGNLYGTGIGGGAYGGGGVYELSPNDDGTWTESVLHSFTGGSDGRNSIGGVIFDSAGNLYGTTANGGASGHGVVFRLTPNSDGTWTESVLYSFKGGKDGTYPDHASLIFDTAGNLYGEAGMGGRGNCNWVRHGCGTVFELTPNSDGTWTETVLYRFAGGNDGATPESTLTFDQAGALYGTTHWGGGGSCAGNGGKGCGTVFRLAPNSKGGWTEQVIHRFQTRGGAEPWGGLVFDASGNLYGTAFVHGLGSCSVGGYGKGCGTMFELVPNSKGGWTEEVLHRFSKSPGGNPFGSVVFDANGNIYGVASGEGTHGAHGFVFEITP